MISMTHDHDTWHLTHSEFPPDEDPAEGEEDDDPGGGHEDAIEDALALHDALNDSLVTACMTASDSLPSPAAWCPASPAQPPCGAAI